MSDSRHAEAAVQPSMFRWRPAWNLSGVRDLGVLVTLLALFIVLSLNTNAFLSQQNLLNILEQWAPVGILALGGTVVIVTRGFDLSIGSMFALSSMVAVIVAQESIPLGVIAGTGTGVACGLVNGVLGTFGRMNVFVATLGTSIVFAGLAARLSNGEIQAVSDPRFGFVNQPVLGIALSGWLFALAIIACSVYLRQTSYGRRTYAIGGNEEAARLAGVRVYAVRIWAFVIAGLGAGLAGVIIASQSLSATHEGYLGIQFNAWTAMLIGGNSLAGGEGAVWRTVVGVLLLALVHNGFNLLGVDPLYQQGLTGVILLVAVGLDALARRRSG